MVYLIGSLRNPEVPKIAHQLREAGIDVFDDWYAAGSTADDSWRDYEKARGRSYLEGLEGQAAKHVFMFDFKFLQQASDVVLVSPAGKSGHMEFGWSIGQGKRGFYLLDNPERWDVMLQLATKVVLNVDDLIKELSNV